MGQEAAKTTKRDAKSFANGWRFRRISDIPKNRLRHSPKRRPSKTSSIAVDAIRTTNFGAIHTRKSWDGSYLAVASRDERDGGVMNHRHPSSSSIKRGMSFNLSREDSRRNGGLRRPVDCRSKGSGGRPLCVTIPPGISSVYTIGFINIAWSRQVTRRVNRSTPVIVSAFSGTVFLLRIGH